MAENKYYITPTGNEIVIREGKAVEQLPLKQPTIINISGGIKTIAEYLTKRYANERKGAGSQLIDPSKVIVVADKNARTITMSLDPENFYGATVTGTLEHSDELKQFSINKPKRYDRKALLDLMRFNRIYFDSSDTHAALVAGLYKLRIKSDVEIQQEKDNSGNRKNVLDIKSVADEGFVKFFSLNIPIFKGFPPAKFQVEVCYELVDNAVSFWLESVGLKEMADSAIDAIFDEQLAHCADFVVVNK